MKRVFDWTLAVGGIFVLGPLLLAIAGAIWCFDGRPIFFRQVRVGRGGVPFRIWKFRTMVANATVLGGTLTIGKDPRVTHLGHWLRKSKLDELPQLFNVLLGEMSFVGPRPEVPDYVEKYSPAQRRVLQLVPGITDVASIKFRHESEELAAAEDAETTYLERIMPEKIRLNLAYAEQANVLRDVVVILKTCAKLAA